MVEDLLAPVDRLDELALTLARAREFARAVGVLDDSRGYAGDKVMPAPAGATAHSDAMAVVSPGDEVSSG